MKITNEKDEVGPAGPISRRTFLVTPLSEDRGATPIFDLHYLNSAASVKPFD